MNKETLYLPSSLREELKKPWGISIWGSPEQIKKQYKEIIQEKGFEKIITVGDQCSLLLSSDIKVFDKLINRQQVSHEISSSLHLVNPPATIQREAWDVLEKAIQNNQNVEVEGEEDLLVIPIVLLSDNRTVVVYGLRDRGICLIEVSPQMKKNFRELLSQFKTKPSS